MPPQLRPALRRKLLRWYDKNRRDLPWRRTRDPYAIWISETMLQQTRVAVVVPYFRRFLAEFPTIDALARARLSRVLRLWAGLGYYRRAENLHRAARQIARRHGGALPQTFSELRSLAGIGDYTAGALLSMAFGKPYPAVDGNARRVIGRLMGTSDERRIRAAVVELLPAARAGEFNQALMELGATLCAPKNRRCADCPVHAFCATGARSTTPFPGRRKVEFTSVLWPLAIIRRAKKILLRRRAAEGLLGGLWELPGGEAHAREPAGAALRRHLDEIAGPLPPPRKLGSVRHAITYRRITAPVYLYDLPEQSVFELPSRWRWVAPDRLGARATSSMTAKACRLLVSRA